jgi:hypothetical protein
MTFYYATGSFQFEILLPRHESGMSVRVDED